MGCAEYDLDTRGSTHLDSGTFKESSGIIISPHVISQPEEKLADRKEGVHDSYRDAGKGDEDLR